MGRGKRLSAEEVESIKSLQQEGYSNRYIAARINRSPRVVNNFVRNVENYGKKTTAAGFKLQLPIEKKEISCAKLLIPPALLEKSSKPCILRPV
jgi:IS30 family transposase